MALLITTTELQDYCTLRGLTYPATPEINIQKATDYIEAVYAGILIGTKAEETQPLLFPRLDDYGEPIDETSLKKAVCSLALRAETSELFEDGTKLVTKEKLDVLEVEYASDSRSKTQFYDVGQYMSVYINGGSNSRTLVRV